MVIIMIDRKADIFNDGDKDERQIHWRIEGLLSATRKRGSLESGQEDEKVRKISWQMRVTLQTERPTHL